MLEVPNKGFGFLVIHGSSRGVISGGSTSFT